MLYAADNSSLHGNWTLGSDPTAAGGRTLVSSDLGASNTVGPMASPVDFVDFTFTAPAATTYHVWLRMRATANSKYNDSVFVQYSNAIDANGAAFSAIGTTNGVTVNLAGDTSGSGLNGWGWQDGAYWLTQPKTIAFATGGSHTLRIQTREDGVSIDQIVLSPTTYLTTPPGPLAGDATIVPKPAIVSVPSPWLSQDVGATGVAGSASFATGLFTVTGAGADIWGTADAFQFVSQAVTGDAQIVARVASLQNVNTQAKAGLMFRDTLAAGSAHVLLDVRPNGSIEFMSRASAGATTTFLAGGTQAPPTWLRLTRSGTTFTGAVSPDGTTWTLIGSTSVALAATGSIGLAVTSHDATHLDMGTFDQVAVTRPPSAPGLPTPANTTSGFGLSTPLTWSAPGAASYDVSFGAGNPPARVATGLTSAAYTPSAMVNGVTYFWQVVAHNAAGTMVGPVWSFTTIVAPPPPPPAAPGAPTPTAGAISVATSTPLTWSASGATSYDVRFGTTTPPPAAITGLTSTVFNPPALTRGATYYWQVTARNTGGATAGPVWSFTAIVAAPGAPGAVTPIVGSTNVPTSTSLIWSAAAGATSYDLSIGSSNPPPAVATNLAGAAYTPATLTSGATYYWQVMARNAGGATAGPVWSFTTVASPTTPAAPTAYIAISDRNTYVKPALPHLGPAGFAFVDPTFGSNMRRVTDGQTRPGSVNRSFRIPSNAHLAAWNANSTAFYVISNDGTVIPYAFNPTTITASRMQAAATGNGGLTLGFYVEPQFSRVDPNIIFGAVSGTNNRTISKYDFAAGTYSTLVDLDTIVPGLAGTYVGGMVSGGTPNENLMTFFGGASQDQHYYALWEPVANLGARKLLNTVASTINGAATGTVLNFHLHSAMIDKSGRFVFLYPTAVDLASPRYASQVYIWDTSSDTITAITSGGKDGGPAMYPGGHDAAGYGTWVNQDCCTSSTWDAAQWQFRDLTSVFQTSDLISPVLANKEVYLADHTSWNNARADALVPVISSTYRYGNNTAPWRAWDDEILGIDTANGGGGLVYRFAHHRSLVASDSDPTTPYFWYEPIANVSPDGNWVVFTSNWEKTLGTDSSEGTFRQDVFLVQLTPHP